MRRADKDFGHFSAILTFVFVDRHLHSLTGHFIAAFRATLLVAGDSSLVRDLSPTGRTAAGTTRAQASTAHPPLPAPLTLTASSSLHSILLP